MGKSFTTIAQQMCLVTGKPYETGELLLDKRMRNNFEMHTVVGWGYSPEVMEKLDQGYIALVEVDFKKSTKDDKGQITPEGAYRLGGVAYVKRHILKQVVPNIEINYMSWAETEFLEYLNGLPINTEGND